MKPRSSSVDVDITSAWGGAPAFEEQEEEEEITASMVVEKEKVVKEIVSMQEGLRALLTRVTDVQNEGAKLKSDNEMLQTYIDNLTRNNAQAAGAGR